MYYTKADTNVGLMAYIGVPSSTTVKTNCHVFSVTAGSYKKITRVSPDFTTLDVPFCKLMFFQKQDFWGNEVSIARDYRLDYWPGAANPELLFYSASNINCIDNSSPPTTTFISGNQSHFVFNMKAREGSGGTNATLIVTDVGTPTIEATHDFIAIRSPYGNGSSGTASVGSGVTHNINTTALGLRKAAAKIVKTV